MNKKKEPKKISLKIKALIVIVGVPAAFVFVSAALATLRDGATVAPPSTLAAATFTTAASRTLAPAFCQSYPAAVRDSTTGSFAHIPAKLIKLSSTCSGVDSRLQVTVDPKVGNVVHATVLADRIARATKGQGNVMVAVWYTAGTSPKGQPLYNEHSTAKYYRDFDNVENLTRGEK